MYENNCDLHQKNTKCVLEKVESGLSSNKKRSHKRSLRYGFK